MILDLGNLRSTNALIREHGEDAGVEAAMRSDTMLVKFDSAVC
jgi:hypothetical protein